MANDGRYVTWNALVGRYKKFAEYGGDQIVITSFLMPAEDEVDSRISNMYAVPFASMAACPGAIKDIVMDLAWYKAIWQQDGSEKLLKRIDDALNRISSGKQALPDPLSPGALIDMNTGAVWSDRQGVPNTFGPDDPITQRIDPDWIDSTLARR